MRRRMARVKMVRGEENRAGIVGGVENGLY